MSCPLARTASAHAGKESVLSSSFGLDSGPVIDAGNGDGFTGGRITIIGVVAAKARRDCILRKPPLKAHAMSRGEA